MSQQLGPCHTWVGSTAPSESIAACTQHPKSTQAPRAQMPPAEHDGPGSSPSQVDHTHGAPAPRTCWLYHNCHNTCNSPQHMRVTCRPHTEQSRHHRLKSPAQKTSHTSCQTSVIKISHRHCLSLPPSPRVSTPQNGRLRATQAPLCRQQKQSQLASASRHVQSVNQATHARMRGHGSGEVTPRHLGRKEQAPAAPALTAHSLPNRPTDAAAWRGTA